MDTVDQSGDVAESKAKRVTIVDVANAVGVAPSTVSRAFARPGRISAELAQRIFETADRMGYRRNPVTTVRSADSRQLNGAIVISVPDLANPVYADYVKGAQHQCLRKGFGLLVVDFEETTIIERKSLQQAMDHADGVILASSRSSDATIRKLAEIKPFIALNRPIRGVQSIVADTSKGMSQALEHLTELGHTNITYLSGPEASWQEGHRWRSLSTLCQESGIRLKRIACTSPTYIGGYRACPEFMESPTSAVMAYNDVVAIGFIKALQARGIRTPQDVSVVGIDDIPVSSLVTPTLSTIRISRSKLAEKAADQLISRICHTAEGQPSSLFVESAFIARGSIGQAKA